MILLKILSENDRFKAFGEIILADERCFYFALSNLEDDSMIQAFKLVPEKDREFAIKTLPYEKDQLRKKLSACLDLKNDAKIRPLSVLKAKMTQESEDKVPECENNNKTAISWFGEID